MAQPFWERGLTPSYKINMQLQYIHTKSYTQILPAALFVVAGIWNQPSCPSVGDWLNNF